MTTSLFFTGLVLPALLFTLVYFPALQRALVLASPYPKATLAKRMYAAAIDGLLVTSCWVVYSNTGSLPYAVIAMIYLLLRDSFAGQSIGKFLVGQVVVHVDTGQRCRLGGSLKRNLFLVLPGANVVAIFLELRTLIRDPQGQRLGDRVAQTQVVEGLGAREVVRALQKWWASFVAELPQGASRPDRVRPVRVPGGGVSAFHGAGPQPGERRAVRARLTADRRGRKTSISRPASGAGSFPCRRAADNAPPRGRRREISRTDTPRRKRGQSPRAAPA